jgi:hypothetical protein
MRCLLLAIVLAAACGGAQKKQPEPAPVAATRPVEPAEPEPTPIPIASSGERFPTIGVASCDELVQRMQACLDSPQFPAQARDQTRTALLQTIDAWAQAATTAEGQATLETGCRQALDSMREAMASMCPGVF